MLGKVLIGLTLAWGLGLPASAACLAEGQVPRTVDFGDGQVVRNIQVRDGLLIYESEAGGQQTYSEVRFGLYPEVMRRGDTENRFDWTGQVLIPAADLPLGQEVEVRAKMSGAASGDYVMAVTNLGTETFALGECSYSVIHLGFRQGEAGAPVMRGDRRIDPARFITFQHEFTTLDKDGSPLRTFGTRARSVD